MKSILMSIRPEQLKNVLNGEATLLLCKRFPKDYVGWVYLYCTKGKPYLYHSIGINEDWAIYDEGFHLGNFEHEAGIVNGKVVARFWCDKVDKVYFNLTHWRYEENANGIDIQSLVCLTTEKIRKYDNHKTLYAINITKLEIFDKPKELKEFYIGSDFVLDDEKRNFVQNIGGLSAYRLTKAPQSWQYVYTKEDK